MAKACEKPEEFSLGIDEKDHALGLLRKLDQMRMQKKECDLIINVEGKEIHVHRNVMMAGSDFFDAMFTHDMEEKQSGVVEMNDISFQVMKKLVEFVYTGKISLTEEECEDLLFASNMLQLTSVCGKIASFLEGRLNPSSVLTLRMLANKFDLANLKKVCDDFALENWDRIVKESEFDSLDKEYITFLITTKKSTFRGGEDSKLAIVIQWIKADVETRSQHLSDMVTLLNFESISPGFGRYLIKNEPLCSLSPEFMKLLYLGVTGVFAEEEKQPNISFRSPALNSLAIFDCSSEVLKEYNPESKTWTTVRPLHSDMKSSFYSAVVIGDFIYVLLGDKKVFKINLEVEHSSWESCPEMLRAHVVILATVWKGDIFVVGQNSMERYCVQERQWREINVAGISNCRLCALVAHNNSIYTIGGYNGRSLADVNRYSPPTSSWSPVAPMPSPQQNSAAAVYGSKIYVAGGYGDGVLTTFMCFDPNNNTWTLLSPMIKGRSYFGLCLSANELYAIGNDDLACSIEKYDFKKGTWKVVADDDNNMKIRASATVAISLPQS